MAGVGDHRHASVGNERYVGSLLQLDDQLRSTRHLVMFVITDGTGADFVMIEELLRAAGVLARNHVRLLQRPNGSQGDVFEVSDGRRHQIELSRRCIAGSRRLRSSRFGYGVHVSTLSPTVCTNTVYHEEVNGRSRLRGPRSRSRIVI